MSVDRPGARPPPSMARRRKAVALRARLRRVAGYKPWLTGMAGFASVVLLGGIGILVFQDHDQYKAQLSEGFRLITGRALVVDGNIRMRIGLSPTLIVEDVSLSNAEWGSRPRMASFRRFEARVALLPLFSGEVRIKRLDLFKGEIFLERDAKGRRNWDFETESGPRVAVVGGQGAIVPATGQSSEAPPVSFDSIRIRDAAVTYLDRAARIRQRVDIKKLSASRARRGRGLNVALTGVYDGRSLTMNGLIGSQFYTESMPYAAPVDLVLRLGSTTVTARGLVGLPFDDERTNLEFTAKGPRLGAALAALHVHVDDPRSFGIAGRLTVADRRWVFDDLAASVGRLTAGGRVTVSRTADGSPVIASLHTPMLDLDGAARRPRPTDAKNWVFDDDRLPHDDLPALNVLLALRADRLKLGGLTLTNAKLSARLDRKVLVVRRFKARLFGGTVGGGVVLDGARRPARTVARLNLRDIDFGALLAKLEISESVIGRGDISARLSGVGGTWREVAKTMNGTFEVAVGKGRVRGSYVDMLGADLLTTIAPWAASISDASVNCMVTQFSVKRGIATVRGLLFDTTRVTVAGKGTIDLRRERFDMKLMPRPKDPSLLSLAAPVNLKGRLNDPSLYPDELSIAKNVAGAVAGGLVNPLIVLVPLVDPGAGEKNSCVAALEKGRGKDGKRKLPEYDDRTFLQRTIEDVGEEIGRAVMDLFGE